MTLDKLFNIFAPHCLHMTNDKNTLSSATQKKVQRWRGSKIEKHLENYIKCGHRKTNNQILLLCNPSRI